MSDGRFDERGDGRARLGVFVVSGLVLCAAGALALGWGRLFEKTWPMWCYFQESVQGLEPGSPISYRGVTIGRVARIGLAPGQGGSGMRAAAVIAVEGDLFPAAMGALGASGDDEMRARNLIVGEVAKGLRVRVAWKDITGQKYLDVDYVDPQEYPVPDLGFMPPSPYIPTALSPSFTDIQRDLATTLGSLSKIDYQRLGAQLQQLLEQLTQKVQDFRSDEVSASFRDAADAIRGAAQDPALRDAFRKIDAAAADLQTLLRRVNDVASRPEVDAFVADAAAAAKSLRTSVESIEGTLPDAVRKMEAVAVEARAAIVDSKLPETAAAVRDGVGEVAGAARSVAAIREDLRVALRQISEAGRNIARLADFLERNPDAVLSGRGGAGGAGTK
ncbi:MAG: hypothetical protein HMLKMBBP_00389 [Planctomycetes bacterium]|nr:hypothetical protein [Planctomycetota bacterium]